MKTKELNQVLHDIPKFTAIFRVVKVPAGPFITLKVGDVVQYLFDGSFYCARTGLNYKLGASQIAFMNYRVVK